MSKNKFLNVENQKQRFSIRKLTIGAASVLIGTVFYLGNNGTTASATVTDGPSTNTPPIQIDVQNNQTTEAVNIKNSAASENSNSQVIVSSDQKVITGTEDQVDKTNKEKTLEAQAFNVKNHAKAATENVLKESKVSTDTAHTDFSVDRDQVNTGEAVTINFNTNEAKAGDIYKVVIPEVSDGFDATAVDDSAIETVDFGQFQGNYGQAEITYNQETKEWIITDTFTKDNANTQPIVLATSSNFRKDKLHSTGNFTRQAYLYKNGKLIKQLNFNQRVTNSCYLYWSASDNNYGSIAKNALYTTSGVAVNNPNSDRSILANTDYEWRLNLSNYNPSFNHGTTLTVPMPDNFVLNTDQTNAANNDILNKYHAVFSQDGKNVTLVLPQLTNDQLKQNLNDQPDTSSIRIIGQFKMDVPPHNVKLDSKDRPAVVQKNNDAGDISTYLINPIAVTVLGKDHGLDDMPIGEVLSATIGPDKYEYKSDGTTDTDKPVTALDDKTAHDLNKNIAVQNETPYSLNNVTAQVDVPDGMDITGLSVNTAKSFSYTFTLNDGTKQTGNYDANNGATVLKVNSGKKIKNIQLTFNKLDAFESTGSFGLNGVLADKYTNGTEVKVGDNLHTDLYVAAKGVKDADQPGHYTQNQVIVAKTPERPEIHTNTIYASGNQSKKNPAGKDAGYINSYTYDLMGKPEKMTYYVVLPTNAVLTDTLKITQLPKGAKVTTFKENDRTIVKIMGDFTQGSVGGNQWYMPLDNSNLITHANLTSDWQVYAVVPEDETIQNKSKVTDETILPFVENSSNAYKLGSGTWNVIAATGLYSTSLAKGNQNDDLQIEGHSDDKGSANMTFSNVIVNGDNNDARNSVVIAHVPGTYDGKSGFDFKLKDANSVQIVDINTGDLITSGVQTYYSTDAIDLNKVKRDDPDLMNNFKTADQITDWSQVKTVLTKTDVIPGNKVYGVNLNGYDPNFASDVNKTSYASFVTWNDLLNPLVINPGDKDSASVNISGKSTVNFRLHFEDGSQADLSVPAADKTYVDGKDVMNQSDFIAADAKNSDFDNAVNYGADKIAKAIIDAVPEDYVLDVESGYKIENSNTKYLNQMQNGTAEFGKTSMYYFDGDTIVYNLVKKANFTNKKVVVKRNIKYLDENEGYAIKPEVKSEFIPVFVSGKYNPLTGNVTDIFDFSRLDQQSFPSVTPDAKVGGYLLDTTKSNSAVQIFQGAAVTAMVKELLPMFDLSKNSGAVISLNEGGYPHLDKQTEDNIFEFDQNVVYYYAPSHANLIVLGQSLGLENQLLDSSSNVNSNHEENENIKFKYNDDSLKREGYTYKIYYFGNNPLSSFTPNYQAEDAVHNITQDRLENNLFENNSGEKFDTLAAAISAHHQYDDYVDGETGVPGNYSQNFFVVYTPVEARKQTLYILSDNDPYAENSITKPYALPKTTEQADASGTDYFKVQGNAGNALLPDNRGGGSAINGLNAYNTYSNGQYDMDPNTGEPIKHNPSIPQDDPLGLSSLSVYGRNGYYIDTATYQVTDKQGKAHTIIIKNNISPNFNPNNGSGFSSDVNMFTLLGYLTSGTGSSGYGGEISLIQDGYNKDTSAFEISIDGLDVKPYTDESGILKVKIPADQGWTFDNTDYDNADGKNIDPAPQVLKLHYAAYPVLENYASVQIHYIDVDNEAPLTSDQIQSIKENNNIDLDPSTNKYSNQIQRGAELQLNHDGTAMVEGPEPIKYDILKADQNFDNTAKDDQIIAVLKKQGYVVVQRDKQTRGSHKFDPYASDTSNHSYDGNGANYSYDPYGNFSSSQNYYVFVKKAHKINYQVVAEDENGNVEKTLVGPTELGIGGTNDNVATSPVNGNGSTDADKQLISDKYQSIIDNLDANYSLVPSTSTDSKLKKTNTLDGMKFTGTQPQLVTIYVTHKKGNVHVHYIDVDSKTPNDEGNFKPSDGTEIANTQQDITNQNYGYKYNNLPWNYDAHNYVLATSSVPNDAISGTISVPNKDVYVYLKHKTTTNTQTTTLHESIKYQYDDGSATDLPDYDRTIKYSRTQIHDLVTDNDGDWTSWTPDKGQKETSFEDEASPTLPGYTPDYEVITAPVPVDGDYIDGQTHDYTYIVKYKVDNQKAKLRFYDDTEGKFIDNAPDISLAGKTDGDINFDPKYDFSNYDFVSVTKSDTPKSTDKLIGDKLADVQYGKFDKDKNTDQVFIAHFKHHIDDVSEKAEAQEIVHYNFEDGTTASPDKESKVISYTRKGKQDRVTKEITWDKDGWQKDDPSENFEDIVSPAISGYTPDKNKVPAKDVDTSKLSKNKPLIFEETVTYTKESPQEPVTPLTPPTDDSKGKTPEKPEKPEKPEEPGKPSKTTTEVKKDKDDKKSSTISNRLVVNSASRTNKIAKSRPNAMNATLRTNSKKLPQTGQRNNNLAILGLLSASLAGLFGLGSKRKRKD